MNLPLSAASSDASGYLQVDVVSSENNFPIADASVTVFPESDSPPDSPSPLERLTTNASGQTELIPLAAPPMEYSLSPGNPRPYSEYRLRVEAPGYKPVDISGTEILAGAASIQNVRMEPEGDQAPLPRDIVIPEHTLYGQYPPKIAETEVKPVTDTGEIVLSRVVVPEIIIVHDGAPSNASAPDYYVPYRDYIRHGASSESYATWPRASIVANVLAILSFTLNRVYTEWYRGQGYDFTITSSTAFDHKWIYGRNIYESISVVVDEIFDSYLSRPNVKQPILTQYCDGRLVSCPGWMTQWGSCSLGEQGYSPIEILRYFYGDSIYINSADQISGIPISWPGYDLTVGSTGDKVRHVQEQLDTIATIYSAIPRIDQDGVYGAATRDAVSAFQSIFGLPATGVIDFATWNKISHIYVGITRLAELS